jgi:type IV pilus assembly protein PilE
MNKRSNTGRGFTLIEMLMVLAIVGILAVVALPSYQQSRLRAGRADGKNALLQAASNQERFYSNSFTYSTNAGPLSTPPQVTVTSADGNYVISVAACGGSTIASCFIATATPQGNQTDDDCGNLTITSTGARAASGGTVEECWQR